MQGVNRALRRFYYSKVNKYCSFFLFFLNKCKKSTTFVLHFTHLTRKRRIMHMFYGHGTVRLWPMILRSSPRMRQQSVYGISRIPTSATCRRNNRSLCGTTCVRPVPPLPCTTGAASLHPVGKVPLSYPIYFRMAGPQVGAKSASAILDDIFTVCRSIRMRTDSGLPGRLT